MSHLTRLALVTAVLVAVVALALAPATPFVASAQDAPQDHWLEVVVEQPRAEADAPVEAARRILGRLTRHDEARAFLDAGGSGSLVRARIWSSIEAVEDSALALDGSPAEGAFDRISDASTRSARLFRRLRGTTYGDAHGGHLELVVFRTRPGTSRASHLELFDAAEPDFAEADGILGHSLWLSADGRWLHLVRWRSAEDFARTGKALMGTKGVGGWIRSLDFKRFTVFRGDL